MKELQASPGGTVFVVFRKVSSVAARQFPQASEVLLTDATDQMQHDSLLTFPPNHGVASQAHFDDLTSWSDRVEPGLKYFSGTATYSKSIHANPDWFKPGTRIVMDLGAVKELAEIELNGKPLETVWKTPYRVDLTRSGQGTMAKAAATR